MAVEKAAVSGWMMQQNWQPVVDNQPGGAQKSVHEAVGG